MPLHTNPAIDQVLDALDAAIASFVMGRPDDLLALWTTSDATSLAGGLGGPIECGRRAVRDRLERVSAGYRPASFTSERLHVHAGQDVAYVVQHERIRFLPEPPPRDAALHAGDSIAVASDRRYRVTMALRREQGGWRVVHRHADPLVSESVA